MILSRGPLVAMLGEIVEKYLAIFPSERKNLKTLLKQLKAGESLTDRQNFIGHVTGSAIILSPDHKKILLIYHPSFKRWQQPGGHWDSDEEGPWQTAERETVEETGVQLAERLSLLENDERVPIQIDSHLIPTVPPKNEPRHYHHDFRYAFLGSAKKLRLEDNVIEKAHWRPIQRLPAGKIKEAGDRALELLELKA